MMDEPSALQMATLRSNIADPKDRIVVRIPRESDRDEIVIARFGKKQQLKRNFGLLSIISLTCTLMITWEGSLGILGGGLTNGGPAGLVYGFIFAWIGNILQALVMSEMASMMPLAGGQYNWVAILSPNWCSKFLSYLTGWITFIAWQATIAGTSYLGGAQIQGLLSLVYPNYIAERWQGTLILWAVLFICVLINTILAPLLPHIESIVFIIHIVGYFCILIPLIYFSKSKGSSADVFQTFMNGGEWPTTGLSFFIGTTTTMFAFVGLDAAGHMAEEIHNAPVIIPRSMLLSVGINGTLGLSMIIAALFCIGDQLDSVMETSTGYPYMQIFFNSTKSVPGTVAMSSVIITTVIFADIGVLCTGSRMTWAFARENGLPGSKLLAKVDHRTGLPLWSIGLSAFISLLLALINIGSTAAFNAFTSLSIGSFYLSFTLAAGILLWKRLTTPDLFFGHFKLGKWAVPIIISAIIYSVIGTFFSFFPPTSNPNLVHMNWSVVVFAAAIAICLLFWLIQGRKLYEGPIMEVYME